MAGLLPMVPAFERAFGIDEHVGDVLHVTHFPFAASYFKQRVVGGAVGIGWIEQQHAAEARSPSGSKGPIFSLDVMDDRRPGPGQKRGHDEAHTFAASGWSKTQHMLGTIMATIGPVPLAEQNAVMLKT